MGAEAKEKEDAGGLPAARSLAISVMSVVEKGPSADIAECTNVVEGLLKSAEVILPSSSGRSLQDAATAPERNRQGHLLVCAFCRQGMTMSWPSTAS